MWWYGQQDSTKGAWDVDIHGKRKYRSRRAGTRVFLRGVVSLILFLLVLFTFPYIMNYFMVEGKILLGKIFNILMLIMTIFLGASILQIPIGLYYFIRYFKVKK